MIPAGVVEDNTTGAELDPVGTSRGAEGIAGTDPAGEWPKAISDLTMFLTRDPSSETTAGERVVEVGVVGETQPPADKAEAVETVVEVEVPEPDDIMQAARWYGVTREVTDTNRQCSNRDRLEMWIAMDDREPKKQTVLSFTNSTDWFPRMHRSV